jgi:hypothetical protein
MGNGHGTVVAGVAGMALKGFKLASNQLPFTSKNFGAILVSGRSRERHA